MRSTLSVRTLATSLALILSACGGTNNPSTSIKVTMTDFTFLPNTFTIPAGEQISLDANNSGAVAHSFLIMKLGPDVRTHFTPPDQANAYWAQPQIAPGTSVQQSFTSPSEPGVYQIVCENAGHFEAGMVAKLAVVAVAH
jgi:uncharacterized cupredoxin-like copper-binding protein